MSGWEKSELILSPEMNLLSSAYKVMPPPRHEVWAVKFPAASTGLICYRLAWYVPVKTGNAVERLNALIDSMVSHLAAEWPEVQAVNTTAPSHTAFFFFPPIFLSSKSHISPLF